MAKRVMVVDDSREVHVQMASLLEDTDYEVAAFCRSGEEAVGRYGQVLSLIHISEPTRLL